MLTRFALAALELAGIAGAQAFSVRLTRTYSTGDGPEQVATID
jgi:hypothetical protein